jgi:hypothetical protein
VWWGNSLAGSNPALSVVKPEERLPISLTVDHELRRVTGIASGSFTMDEMRHYIEERVRQGAFSYPQILDLRDCEFDIPDYESLFARAVETRRAFKAGPFPKTAFVANTGTATYGFVRQLATQAGFANAAAEVFSDRDEALAWLKADGKSSD